MNWQERAEQFKLDYQETRVSLKQWCDEHDIDYQCARKHISVKVARASINNQDKAKRQKVITSYPNKVNRTSFKQGNQWARKHGAYAKLLSEDNVEIASSVRGLDNELLVCRARLVSVLKAKNELDKQWKYCSSVEEKIQLAEAMLKLVHAEDRAVARIESVSTTLSKLARDKVLTVKDNRQMQLIDQTIKIKEANTQKDEQVVFNLDW